MIENLTKIDGLPVIHTHQLICNLYSQIDLAIPIFYEYDINNTVVNPDCQFPTINKVKSSETIKVKFCFKETGDSQNIPYLSASREEETGDIYLTANYRRDSKTSYVTFRNQMEIYEGIVSFKIVEGVEVSTKGVTERAKLYRLIPHVYFSEESGLLIINWLAKEISDEPTKLL